MKVGDIEEKSSEYDAETRTDSVGKMVLTDLVSVATNLQLVQNAVSEDG